MEGKEAKELKIKRFNTALNQDYRNIAPAVKYRRFYLPKFPFAALSSVDVAPLRLLLPPCRWKFILRKIRRHLTAGVIFVKTWKNMKKHGKPA